ncbi:ATP dependent DNA ligase [Capsaspora owczarzaki ATCC 30864]|uniref:DNA ligase n=1 Tax=Capsaspora owczarzaki (strain ATCC 30864) TaxID=595528 RepID=A0A0D2X3G4_CAPO3|nr:ATP dependent DNA ligase [Capsaspora owczarzaki ATCC 30864]KJE94264.1 ATP dependent DNA ligase [Capsaspora owczarzaki ATCC 30864]|eukprot:XP_004347684.1 ATP dependent DNA ligase [Capsaspora owczarzaki ATCC 30864]
MSGSLGERRLVGVKIEPPSSDAAAAGAAAAGAADPRLLLGNRASNKASASGLHFHAKKADAADDDAQNDDDKDDDDDDDKHHPASDRSDGGVLNPATGDLADHRRMDNSDIPPEGNCGDSVPFAAVATLLEQISSDTKRSVKQNVLGSFLQRWRENGKSNPNTTVFPIVRLLLPSFDRERGMYGIKDAMLAKYYSDILGIVRGSEDYNKLKNYTKPQHNRQSAGDFAMVAFFVLQRRLADRPSNPLTVTDVNTLLDQLATEYMSNNRPGVKDTLRSMLFRSTAREQKWLIRIIGKDVKCGMSAQTVLKTFHQDAVDLFNVCSNLRRVCWQLRDPTKRLVSNDVSLFHPFRPMLAMRENISKIADKLGTFFMEIKFDGDRVMMHKQGDKYQYWSRKSINYSDKYGFSPDCGTITQYVHNAFKPGVTDVILDGEMILYDTKLDCFVPKSSADVKSFAGTDEQRPCYVVFDIVFLNGTSLCNMPLIERLRTLRKVFTPITGRIMFADQRTGTTSQEIIDFLNEAIDNREEGVMVKNMKSTYAPDKRDGGWYKIKPEYGDSFAELDVLIVGGYYGIGKRRGGMVSHFMCAVAVPPANPQEPPTVFHSFCKVGTGYSMSQLKEFGEQLEPHWHPFDTQNPPSQILLATGFKERPDVWIEPRHSRIVQIRAAEITPTEKYKCGFTLRFPRLECFRTDKEWSDCMTTTELDHAYRVGQGRLATTHFLSGDGEKGGRKQKAGGAGVAAGTSKTRTVLASFRGADLSGVKIDSELFQGLTFYVVNGSADRDKNELEKLIARHGGELIQNPPRSQVAHVVAIAHQEQAVRVKNIKAAGVCDIVRPSWIDECVKEKRVVPKRPTMLIFATELTRVEVAKFFDAFGDSYFEDTDEATLRTVFASMATPDPPKGVVPGRTDAQELNQTIAEIEDECFPDEIQGLFRGLTMYLDRFSHLQSSHHHSSNASSLGSSVESADGSNKATRSRSAASSSKKQSGHAAAATTATPTTTILGVRADAIPFCALDLVALRLVRHGAVVVDYIDSSVTHIVLSDEDHSRLPAISKLTGNLRRRPRVVSSAWVSDCVNAGGLVDERSYHPVGWTVSGMQAAGLVSHVEHAETDETEDDMSTNPPTSDHHQRWGDRSDWSDSSRFSDTSLSRGTKRTAQVAELESDSQSDSDLSHLTTGLIRRRKAPALAFASQRPVRASQQF